MLRKELENSLCSAEEPLNKRIIIADRFYKCTELIVPHKELFFFKWIIENSNQNNEECWSYFNNWLQSAHLKKLNRNDVNKEEFIGFIELVCKKLSLIETIDNCTLKTVMSSVLLLVEVDIFHHYFKHDVIIYCKLISSMIQQIKSFENCEEFLQMNLFSKDIITQEKFHKNFFEIILPKLINCVIKFQGTLVFELISKLIQKCLFFKNHRIFKVFIGQFFEDVQVENEKIPEYLFQYIIKVYETDDAPVCLSVIFHAMCTAYNFDFELIYKFFILFVHLIGFNLKDKLLFYKTDYLHLPTKNKSLIKSQNILLGLINVLSENKNDLTFKVSNTTLAEFILNILKQLIYLRSPSTVSYKIFIRSLIIDPLLVESIIENIIFYAMILDNHKQSKYYEHFIIQVFDIYSKLHRIENLISKMVHTFNYYFDGKNKPAEEIYKFNGDLYIEEFIAAKENIVVYDIFTDNILQKFSECIYSLASWQIINIFKTLLYHLHEILNNIDKNVGAENFVEIMSILLNTLLSSIRIAEHSTVSNVVEKSVKELEELKTILKQFGMVLLNREHNQKLMRAFLNISFNWAEVYIMLEYYSINNEVQLNKIVDNDFAACNITYLHSYLTVKQWCLISERITNFGEIPCKQLLEKLFIQKLQAMLIFEKSINEDIVQNIVKSLSTNIEVMWGIILQNQYAINILLKKMDPQTVMFLAEKLITDTEISKSIQNYQHIKNSSILITAINYVLIIKINKTLTKRNVTIDNTPKKATKIRSSRISLLFTEDNLSIKEPKEVLESVKTLYCSNKNDYEVEWNINEEKVASVLQVLTNFPVIFCSEDVQKLCLMYFCSLHKDFSFEFKRENYKQLKIYSEKLIIGILQHNKFKLVDLFATTDLCKDIVENYDEREQVFYLITENIFKDEYSILTYEPTILGFVEKLSVPEYLQCCIIIINIINKMKKNKMSKSVKIVADKYKSIICDKILDVVLETNPTNTLIDGYSCVLKHFLLNNEAKLSKLLIHLESYVNLALKETEQAKNITHLMLFITVLENNVKMQSSVGDNVSLKIWDVCKRKNWMYSGSDKHAHLIQLIFGLVPNEEFSPMITDFLKLTTESIKEKNYQSIGTKLKMWELVLSCNLSPQKTKIVQNNLEKLLQNLTLVLQWSSLPEVVFENICNLEKTITQATHVPLTASVIDTLMLIIKLLCDNLEKYKSIFNLSVTLLESLLKYRKPLMMDRLPLFLQLYRMLLRCLCKRSSSDLNLEELELKIVSNHAHLLEKLTKNLVLCQKDMARIAMYLIADVLQNYAEITLHSNIKIHLNNCIYSLLTICDQHAIAFLMRNLSSASTELFKDMYENYKKFYRYTGKV